MEPYYEQSHIKIFNKDCRSMDELSDESIDLLVTDPPYGISFMGKDWDTFNEMVEPQGAYQHKKGFKKLPRQNTISMTEFFIPIWEECLRILKPGAFAFVMCSPRADVMAKQVSCLQEAGFEVGFTPLFWGYASGFPKAQNIGKVVDKKAGRIGKSIKSIKNIIRRYFEESELPLNQFNKKCGFEASGYLRQSSTWEGVLPSFNKWLTIKAILSIPDDYDDIFREAERDIFRQKQWDNSIHHFTPTANHKERVQLNETLPATPQAKALDGSYGGFQPKPAVEVIIVAMKPLSEKTYVDQALKDGKGITWLDDGRIPYESEDKPSGGSGGMNAGIGKPLEHQEYRGSLEANPSGRFPANLLVSDDVLNNGRITVSSGGKSGHTGAYSGGYKEEYYGGAKPGLGDSGSFSRYFDLDKWWEKRIKQLPESAQKTFPFLIAPKASKSEKNRGIGLALPRTKHGSTPRKNEAENKSPNYHPTVKPLKLMSYLTTLGSREGDTVVDPFIGTGSTAIACQILGRRCTGYEINPDYCEIAKGRLSWCWQQVFDLSKAF